MPQRPSLDGVDAACEPDGGDRAGGVQLPARICNHCLNPACVAACPAAPSTSAAKTASSWSTRTSAGPGGCACRPAPTRRSITTGRPESPRSASCASRGWKPARLRRVPTPVSAASVTWACFSTTPTGSPMSLDAGRGTAGRPARHASSIRGTSGCHGRQAAGIDDDWIEAARGRRSTSS